MSIDNKTKFMEMFGIYITNINRTLKNIKSDIMADFIWIDQVLWSKVLRVGQKNNSCIE